MQGIWLAGNYAASVKKQIALRIRRDANAQNSFTPTHGLLVFLTMRGLARRCNCMLYSRLQATPDYSYYAYCVLCMETQIEDSWGLTTEMGKRLLKKPDATVDSVLKVRSHILNGRIHAVILLDTNYFVSTPNWTINAVVWKLGILIPPTLFSTVMRAAFYQTLVYTSLVRMN